MPPEDFPDLPILLPDIAGFADVAGLIANLDAVVSIDSAVAHLAGAMGNPLFLLLASDPDWRWHLDRTDSPWYPTARLIRQHSPGDWSEVLSALRQALT